MDCVRAPLLDEGLLTGHPESGQPVGRCIGRRGCWPEFDMHQAGHCVPPYTARRAISSDFSKSIEAVLCRCRARCTRAMLPPMESIVTRDDLQVIGVRCADRIEEIQQIWPRLEEIVGPLHGRRFFGAMYAEPREYRACV